MMFLAAMLQEGEGLRPYEIILFAVGGLFTLGLIIGFTVLMLRQRGKE